MKLQKIISTSLRILIAIILLQTLYFKFTAHPDSVHIFSELGVEPWGRIGLGIIELITALLILIPRTQIIGVILSLGIISGAIFSHLLVIGLNVSNDGGGLFSLAIIVLVSAVVFLILNKQELIGIIKKFRHS
jgi:hypothetical protein